MMFDASGFHASPYDDGIDQVEPFAINGVHDSESPSDRYAWKITDAAVRNIASHATRQRVKHLLLSKVADQVSVGAASPHVVELSESANAWVRYATVNVRSDRETRMIIGRRGSPKTHFAHVKAALNQLGDVPSIPADDVSAFVLGNVQVPEKVVLSVSPDVDTDSALPTSGFVPSSDLVAAWVDGLNAVRREAGQAEISASEAESNAQFSTELAKQLRKVISNFAKRKSYEGGRYRITFAHKLLPSVEGLIEDHLMMPPRNAVAFLDLFREELYAQSADGAVFMGRWGQLVIDSAEELVLILNKRRSRKLMKVLKG